MMVSAPFGFSLEAYDAVGRFRERDLGGRPVETHAKMMDGAEFDGLDGLRNYLLTAEWKGALVIQPMPDWPMKPSLFHRACRPAVLEVATRDRIFRPAFRLGDNFRALAVVVGGRDFVAAIFLEQLGETLGLGRGKF